MKSIPNIFSKELDCSGCPAEHLLDTERSKLVETIRLEALKELGSSPKILLLCESAPTKRFVYDTSSNYDSGGLRANLREELTDDCSGDSLFEYLNQKKVWIIDSALCPLHKLETKGDRRHAATICMFRHTRAYFDAFPSARVISIFPSKCGFLKKELPQIDGRIERNFDFNNLDGLKSVIEQADT